MGSGLDAIVLSTAIVAIVAYFSISKRDVQHRFPNDHPGLKS